MCSLTQNHKIVAVLDLHVVSSPGHQLGNPVQLLDTVSLQAAELVTQAGQMRAAVAQGDLERLAQLLREAPDAIDQVKSDGLTALMIACELGNVGCARLLCEAGARSDTQGALVLSSDREVCSFTALILACRKGSPECVNLLLCASADVDKPNEYGDAPLQYACGNGQSECVQLLLAAKAAVDGKQSEDGPTTPLLCACMHGDHTIAKQLLDAGASAVLTSHQGRMPLAVAIIYNHPAVAQLLSRHVPIDAPLDGCGNTALVIACSHGRVAIVRLLCEAGAAINQPNFNNSTALIAACREGHTACISLLLDANAAIDLAKDDGVTALLTACHKGHVESARLLLGAGAAVDQPTKHGDTPLIHACWKGDPTCVKLLLSASAAVNQTSENRGVSPLLTACDKGDSECAKLLLSANADVNQPLNDGNTPLLLATYRGDVGI
eukprot:2605346-Prymnesium_polylepis.1